MAASPPTSLFLSIDTIFSSHLISPSFQTFPFSSHHLLSLHCSHPFSFKYLHASSPPPSVESLSTTGFLDSITVHRRQTLENFHFIQEFDHGVLEIRPMKPDELELTVNLLTESFVESMLMPHRYVQLLSFLLRQYVVERRDLVPHTVMLVGFYKEKDGGMEAAQLACTAEISFDARGAIAAPPTPVPPKDYPYICNITVKQTLRRRGIGRLLLKKCEELISQMKTLRKVYLHCRMIDKVPFNMYKKAGYKVAKTDSILIWFTFQRRKYLMCKELPASDDSKLESLDFNDHPI